MTVTFVKRAKPKKTKGAFGKWYESHKTDFNFERRNRYHNDPLYRQAVLAQARKSREERRKSGVVKPETYSWKLPDVASYLGITLWTLRNWRQNNYYPEPARYNSELWFTEQQVKLLGGIATYFQVHNIRRMSAIQKKEMEEIVAGVHSTWGN
jgi:hypothetical protein